MNLFEAYRSYPFPIPPRVRFFNLFRWFFLYPSLERFLVARINNGHRYWKKLIPPLYFYPEGSLREAKRNGIRYRLDISKELEHSIYFDTVRDVAWTNLFKRLAPAATVIDAGANIGYLTLQFAEHAKAKMVHAFEPDSENFHKLSHNVSINDADNIRVYRTALGAKADARFLFGLYKNNPGTNRILPETPQHALSCEEVEVAALDFFLDQGYFESGVDLIKVDVEGFELFVLQGALNTIQRFQPVLFVELIDENLAMNNCSGQSVVEFIRNLGYVVLDAQTMRPLVEVARYYTDILCYPREKIDGST